MWVKKSDPELETGILKKASLILTLFMMLVSGPPACTGKKPSPGNGLENANLSEPSSIPLLARALKEGNQNVKTRAISALAKLAVDHPRALRAIEPGLKDSHTSIRVFTCKNLLNLKTRALPSAPALLSALGDQEDEVRFHALLALHSTGYKENDFVESVMDMRRYDSSRKIREYAKNILPLLRPDLFFSDPDENEAGTPLQLQTDEDTQYVTLSWYKFLLLQLGGVNIHFSSGKSTVKSFVSRSVFSKSEVASGGADFKGFEIALRRPPVKGGFSFFLTPRYLKQSITIKDFQQDIPVVKSENRQEIPFDVTVFETGEPVDPGDPNTYKIDIGSFGIFMEGAYEFRVPLGEASYWLFNMNIGASIAEKITTELALGLSNAKESKWEVAKSVRAGVSTGLSLDRLHSTLTIGFQFAHYPDLTLPENLEFRDKLRFNKQKDIFERERLFLDKVQFQTFSAALSYTYSF
ncbi:MAG: HEAT repeat domain-containing protein [Nitrospinota bacterium]